MRIDRIDTPSTPCTYWSEQVHYTNDKGECRCGRTFRVIEVTGEVEREAYSGDKQG